MLSPLDQVFLKFQDEKVWIQHDGTEDGIAEELVEKGIPRQKIVRVFKSPEICPHTDFGFT